MLTPITPAPRTRTFIGGEPEVAAARRPRRAWCGSAQGGWVIRGAASSALRRFCTRHRERRRWSTSLDVGKPAAAARHAGSRTARHAVSLMPPFIAPATFDDAGAALARVREIYDGSVDHLRDALQAFVTGAAPVGPRARLLSVRSRPHRHRRARRFAPQLRLRRRPGHVRDDADAARPVRELLPRAVPAAAAEPRRLARGRDERAADPGPLLVRRARPHRGQPQRRTAAAAARPVRPARSRRDGRRHRQRHLRRRAPGEARPLALFTAPRVDYSLHRLRHYTGTDPEHFQNFVLFTNYQFYIDEFVRLGHEAMAGRPSSRLRRVRRAGQRDRARVGPGARPRRRPRRRAAAPAADAGLSPGARRRQRHHDGQHRRRARPTRRRSPTTSRCCARTPG